VAEVEQPIEASDSTTIQGEAERQGHRPPKRRGPRDEEPLVVEIAWLVIEAATVLYRLRRILTRL
jgi:hypothetical protein